MWEFSYLKICREEWRKSFGACTSWRLLRHLWKWWNHLFKIVHWWGETDPAAESLSPTPACVGRKLAAILEGMWWETFVWPVSRAWVSLNLFSTVWGRRSPFASKQVKEASQELLEHTQKNGSSEGSGTRTVVCTQLKGASAVSWP